VAVAAPTEGAHRIVVVDDDPGIRLVLGRALARWGYDVFLAGTAKDALEALQGDIDVVAVVSDVAMPAMDGLDLAGEILRHHAGVPILFLTGSPVSAHLLANPLVGLLGKPARVSDVRVALDDLIERTSVAAAAVSGRSDGGGPRS